MATYSNSAREVEMPNGDVVVIHNAPTGGENTTSNIKKFKYDDNGHVTESTAANATDLNLNSYSTPTTGSTAIGTSDAVQTAIGKLDHQSQIDQSNILYALNTGANNLLDLSNATMVADSSLTVTRDGNSYVVSGNPSTSVQVTFTDFVPCVPITGGKIAVVGCPSGGSTQNGYSLRGYLDNSWRCSDTGSDTKEFTTSSINKIVLYFAGGHQYTNVRFTPMVVSEEVWNTLGSDYRPPALPNYDLTRLESEDRSALAEEIDAGAKNKLDFASVALTQQHPDTGGNVPVYTKTNTSFAISGKMAWVRCVYGPIHLKAGTYVLYTNITAASISSQFAVVRLSENADNTSQITRVEFTTTGKYSSEFTISAERNVYISFCPNYSDTDLSTANSFTATDLMICTKAAFGVSSKFVPYRPNWDLVAEKLAMNEWKYVEQLFSASVQNVYVYTNVSFTVPANQLFEFYVSDRYTGNATGSNALAVSDSNTAIDSNVSIIVENTQEISQTNKAFWTRQVSGITPRRNSQTTYYIWVNRAENSNDAIQLAYRRIV